MYPYPVSNSVPGQQGKYRGAKGEQGREGQWGALPSAAWQMELKLCAILPLPPGSLPPQRSDQHQPASAPPMMQAAAAAGPPLVAATPYSSYIPYNPQQFPGQPAMMQPMAHYPSQVTGPRQRRWHRGRPWWRAWPFQLPGLEGLGERSRQCTEWGRQVWASLRALVGPVARPCPLSCRCFPLQRSVRVVGLLCVRQAGGGGAEQGWARVMPSSVLC